ncbi:MAG: hypothetical protein HKN45_09410 [Flavobacteriales bacterium]|nr:hypothetical protein [Flavobacteriales bacterium]
MIPWMGGCTEFVPSSLTDYRRNPAGQKDYKRRIKNADDQLILVMNKGLGSAQIEKLKKDLGMRLDMRIVKRGIL